MTSLTFIFHLQLPVMLQAATTQQPVNWYKTLALVVIILIVLLFFILALYSNMLRDEVDDCDAFNANAEKLRQRGSLRFIKNTNPFSLSRVQLAVWTAIISSSYIYLQLCMPNCNTTELNQTALVLMGIGAAVTTTGVMIDKKDIQNGMPRHQNTPSQGFFTDILSDDNGISIPRFQNVIWTGIAIIIYLNKVYQINTGCALPELGQTLLALTGISSATYLALKTQENNPPAGNVQQQGAASNMPQSTPVAPAANVTPAAVPPPITADTGDSPLPPTNG